MDGGAATSRVQEGVQAAEKLAPLANQYPIAFALLVVAAMAILCIAIFYRRDSARSAELAAMTQLASDLMAIVEVQSNQLDCLPTLLASTKVMSLALKLEVADLEEAQKELQEAQKKAEELAAKRRAGRRGVTGSVPIINPVAAGGSKEGGR